LLERAALKEEAEGLRSDSAAVDFIHKQMAGEGKDFEAAVEDYWVQFKGVQDKFEMNQKELQELLGRVRGGEGELVKLKMISDGVRECEGKVEKLAAAVDECGRIVEAIREGAVFYVSVHDPVKNYSQQVQGFVTGRKMEAADLKAEVERKKEEQERIDQALKESEARMREDEQKQREHEQQQREEEEAREVARRLAGAGAASVVRQTRVQPARPAIPPPPRPPAPIPSPPQPATPPTPPPATFIEAVEVSPGGGNQQVPTVSRVPQNAHLPTGWEAKEDPRSGRTFYIDHNTKTTHWKLPSAPASPADDAKGFRSRRPPALDGVGRPDTSLDAAIARSLAADGEPGLRVDTSEDELLARQLLREMTDSLPDAQSAGAPRPNTANDEAFARCVPR